MPFMPLPKVNRVEWLVARGLVPYPEAVTFMEERAAAIREKAAAELIWLLQHPPLYTAGTSAKPADLLEPERFPVYEAGRGGQYTYHGPGQRIIYTMLDLDKRGRDVRAFVHSLEEWIILSLREFGIEAERRPGRVGLWIERQAENREDKIAAIGIRLKKWVSYHGIAININPDLSHFSGIVPCGIASGPESHFGVTSLADLGRNISIERFDEALKKSFYTIFES